MYSKCYSFSFYINKWTNIKNNATFITLFYKYSCIFPINLSSKTKASNDELLKEVNHKIEFSNIYIRKINATEKYNVQEKNNYYNQQNGTILNDYQNK